MKEKIVICTLYDSVNCGTFLQAYSLMKKLEELDYDVYFLKLKNNNTKINKKIQKMTLKTILLKIKRKAELYFLFKKTTTLFKVISLEELNKDDKIKYVIIGSDEIWNVKNNSFVHYKEYFGYNFKNKKIIAYAPSANDSSKEDLLTVFKDLNFNNFLYLSARDQKTKELLYSFDKKNVEDVIDPTMIVTNLNEIKEDIDEKDYIIIYGHSFSNEQVKEICDFSKKIKKKTISITKYFPWCDINLIVSPGKFLAYIENADFIITSTFHGSVFSILYNKEFAVYANNGSKIVDLLSKFKLEDRIVKTNLDKTFENKINYPMINGLLEKYRKKSIDYLIKSLKGDKRI